MQETAERVVGLDGETLFERQGAYFFPVAVRGVRGDWVPLRELQDAAPAETVRKPSPKRRKSDPVEEQPPVVSLDDLDL